MEHSQNGNNATKVFKKIFLYGLPILAVVLVIAVLAASFLTETSSINAAFGKADKDQQAELKADLDTLKNEEQKLQKETKNNQNKTQDGLKSTSLDSFVQKEKESIERNTLNTKEDETKQNSLSVEEIKALAQNNTLTDDDTKASTQTERKSANLNPVDETPAEQPEIPEEQPEVPEEQPELPEEQPEVPGEEQDPSDENGNNNGESSKTDFEETWVDKYVNTDVLNIRNLPDFNAETMGTLEKGEMVTEISTNHEWSKILLDDNVEAFVYNYYLTTEKVVKPDTEEKEPEETIEESEFTSASGTKYIAYGVVNVRKDANTSSDILSTLYYGETVELSGYANGWYQVVTTDGNGYIREDLLRDDPVPEKEQEIIDSVTGDNSTDDSESEVTETAPPEQTVAPGNSGGVAAANIALSKINSSYVYGAAGPDAFDCSGLVQYAVINAGGYISRSSYTQAYDGIAVPFSYGDYSQLAPGDVLLFAFGSGGVSHAGMYVGNGTFIHAMNQQDGIQISNVSDWANSLAYVRRVFY